FGLLVGAPTAILAWLVFGRAGGDMAKNDKPNLTATRIAPPYGAPSVWTALFIVLLPVGLMILGSGAQVVLPDRSESAHWLIFVDNPSLAAVRRWWISAGAPVVAMLTAVLLALYFLGFARGFNRRQLLQFCEASLLD